MERGCLSHVVLKVGYRLVGVPEGGPQSASKINTSFTFI